MLKPSVSANGKLRPPLPPPPLGQSPSPVSKHEHTQINSTERNTANNYITKTHTHTQISPSYIFPAGLCILTRDLLIISSNSACNLMPLQESHRCMQTHTHANDVTVLFYDINLMASFPVHYSTAENVAPSHLLQYTAL